MKAFRPASSTVSALLFAAVFAFLALPSRGQSVASLPQPTDYVSDFAHVLSPQTVAQLDSICGQLDHSKTSTQMAIVTVNNLNGDDIDDYADNLEDHWKMGKKGSDRDVLVLLAIQDHKYRIEIGYDLEGLLNDAKVGDIGRTMIPGLRAGDYDGAVTLAVDQLAQDIAADAGVAIDLNGSAAAVPVTQPVHRASPIGKLILLVIVLLFFGGFSIIRMLLFGGLFFGGWGGPWVGGGPPMGGGFGGGGGGDGFSGFGGFGGGFGGGGAGGSW